jgi:hypothetical protein
VTHHYPSFTDKQFRSISAAAARLPRHQRNDFLTGVARRLGDAPSDEAVEAAITAQLAINRLPAFITGTGGK